MRNTRKPQDRLLFLSTSFKCSTNTMVVLVSLKTRNRLGSFSTLACNIYTSDKCEKELKSGRCGLGFPHPRDCSKCVCPSGYEGPRCDQKVTYRDVVMRNSFTALCVLQPSGCGRILNASPNYETLRDVVGDRSAGTGEREDFVKCYYWIMITGAPTLSSF